MDPSPKPLAQECSLLSALEDDQGLEPEPGSGEWRGRWGGSQEGKRYRWGGRVSCGFGYGDLSGGPERGPGRGWPGTRGVQYEAKTMESGE